MGADTPLEALADQTRTRLRRGELIGVFQVVVERQMHRAGLVERSEPPDPPAAARRAGPTEGRTTLPGSYTNPVQVPDVGGFVVGLVQLELNGVVTSLVRVQV